MDLLDQLTFLFARNIYTIDNKQQQFEEVDQYSKSTWDQKEEQALLSAVERFGIKNWTQVAENVSILSGFPLRNNQQVSQHWRRVADPNIKKGVFTEEEIEQLIQLYRTYGNKYVQIAKILNRTDVSIKYKLSQLSIQK